MPAVLRHAIVELKAEYPGFRPNELARICYVRFGRRPSPHTVKRVLAEDALPVQAVRRYPPYAQITDPVERRLAIVRLHAEGWGISSITGYLQTTRRRVYQTLQRWMADGVQGLDDEVTRPEPPSQED